MTNGEDDWLIIADLSDLDTPGVWEYVEQLH